MKYFFILIIFLFSGIFILAQDVLDWDIDSIFNEETEYGITPLDNNDPVVPIQALINPRGFLFTTSFMFNIGLAPGWFYNPFDVEWDKRGYYLDRYIRMSNTFSIDAQITEDFRVYTALFFELPNFRIQLGDFYFDYKIYDVVFFRGGKYSFSWGISPNYNFTDLLARIPNNDPAADSFLFRTDIPIGKGGFQALALTRYNLMDNSDIEGLPKINDFGFGAKYNLVLSNADLNAGMYYKDRMPLRSFISAKTTLWSTELYTEGLLAIDVDGTNSQGGAFNIGFERELFNKKLNINGELFYNFEEDTYWYEAETNIREAITSKFVEGFNIAFNVLARPWIKNDHRLFLRVLYAPMQDSAQLIPGIKLRLWSNIELYIAAPISLGPENGFYRKNTLTFSNEDPLPFAVVFMVTLNGSVRFRHNY